jgi:hypothetical protein
MSVHLIFPFLNRTAELPDLANCEGSLRGGFLAREAKFSTNSGRNKCQNNTTTFPDLGLPSSVLDGFWRPGNPGVIRIKNGPIAELAVRPITQLRCRREGGRFQISSALTFAAPMERKGLGVSLDLNFGPQ